MTNSFFEVMKGQADNLPNRFSLALGELIRKARLDAHLSQSELANSAYLNQAAVSQIEKGKRSVSAEEIVYLSVALNKPIIYFFPVDYLSDDMKFTQDDLSLLDKELLSQARRLTIENLRRLIAQARALADLDE